MLHVPYKKCATAQLQCAIVCHLIKIPTRTNVCRSISDSDMNPWQDADRRHFKILTSDLGTPRQGLRKNWVLNIWASKFEFWSHWWPVSNNFKSWFPHNHWNPAISSQKSLWPALKRSALWKMWKLFLARFIVSRKMEMSVCSGTKPYQQTCTNCNLMDSYGARLSAAQVQSQSKPPKIAWGLISFRSLELWKTSYFSMTLASTVCYIKNQGAFSLGVHLFSQLKNSPNSSLLDLPLELKFYLVKIKLQTGHLHLMPSE